MHSSQPCDGHGGRLHLPRATQTFAAMHVHTLAVHTVYGGYGVKQGDSRGWQHARMQMHRLHVEWASAGMVAVSAGEGAD